jgi:hypothetical protein
VLFVSSFKLPLVDWAGKLDIGIRCGVSWLSALIVGFSNFLVIKGLGLID